MSEHFYQVKTYYDEGLWSGARVRSEVGRWITEEEFFEIVGENVDKEV